ncbi:hypothetical protein GGQ68_004143 [Sagittula marina]|uniref:Uncharacterized protein n=1 Tax=Sagittula marina TaxID=943940 RepID=A0A7W6DS33_9RHOB|nr:hypothetical protein [Sagittula marina]
MFQQVGQHGCIADIACRDADRADLQRFRVHTEVKLAPQAFLAPAMLARAPLSFTFRFDPGRVDQQVQRTRSSAIGDRDAQRLLAATQGAEVRHFPVKACQSQQAFDEPRRLPKGHTKQYLHRKTNLNCRIAELALAAAPAGRRGRPFHLGIKPDR